MSRVADSWEEVRWDGGRIEYRVLEDAAGLRRLEVRCPYETEFRPPSRSHAAVLARRLLRLRTEDDTKLADVLPMERSA